MTIYRVPNECIVDTREFIGPQEGRIACLVDPDDKDRFFTVPCESCESFYRRGFTEIACKENEYVNSYPAFLYGLERKDWKNWSFDPADKKLGNLLSALKPGSAPVFGVRADEIRRGTQEVEVMKIPSECLFERVIRWDENVPRETIEKRYEIRVEIGGLLHRLPVATEALGYSRSHKTYYLDIRRGKMRCAAIDLPEGRVLAPVAIDDVKAALDGIRRKIKGDE